MKKEISEIKYDEITGLSVFTSKNTHIYFGKGDYEVKIKNLKIILNDYSKKEYSKAREFYTKILSLKNINNEFYKQAKLQLTLMAND